MAKKETNLKVDDVVEKVKTIEKPIETLVLRPRMKLTVREFEVLEEQIELLNKKEETKVILIPYSCEVVEDVVE